jgi:Glycosyltransferase family 10 (fucosyltransferase) C-term
MVTIACLGNILNSTRKMASALDYLDVNLLKGKVNIVDDISRANFLLSLNSCDETFPLERTLLILVEPPHCKCFRDLYAKRGAFHSVFTYTPEGRNHLLFSRTPAVFPQYPGPYRRLERIPTITKRGVYFAGEGNRLNTDDGYGAISLASIRANLVGYLQRHYVNTHIFGRGWPFKSEYTGQSGFRKRKLAEIKLVGADFVLCIENMMMPNYISEKLHDAFISDRVPLYLGEPHITEHLTGCLIDLRRFLDTRTLTIDCESIVELLGSFPADLYRDMIERARLWRANVGAQYQAAKAQFTRSLLERLNISQKRTFS